MRHAIRPVLAALALMIAAAEARSQDDGLRGYWKFDESAGPDFQDSSISGNTAVQSGPVTPTSDAAPQPASNPGSLSLGGDGYVEASPASFTEVYDTFTMAFWANPTAERDSTEELNYGITGVHDQRYAIFPTHGTIAYGDGHCGAGVSVGTNGISVFEHADNYLPSPLVYDTEISGWTHVAVIYRDGQPSLYINGVWAKGGVTSTGTVHPGSGFGGAGDMWTTYGLYCGGLDELRIYNRALSDAELIALASGASSPPSPSPAPSPTAEPGDGGGGGKGGGGCSAFALLGGGATADKGGTAAGSLLLLASMISFAGLIRRS